VESSVSYSKIDVTSLPYPSCADSIVLTANDPDLAGSKVVARLVALPRPPSIVKPIGGLPSKQDERSTVLR